MSEQLLKLVDAVISEKYSEADPIIKDAIAKRLENRTAELYNKFDSISKNIPLHETKLVCEAVMLAEKNPLPIRVKALANAVVNSTDADHKIELINQAASPQISRAHSEATKMAFINPFNPEAATADGGCIKQINDALFSDSKWKSALKDLAKAEDNVADPDYYRFVTQYCDAVSTAFNAYKNTNMACFDLINRNFPYLEAVAKKYA